MAAVRFGVAQHRYQGCWQEAERAAKQASGYQCPSRVGCISGIQLSAGGGLYAWDSSHLTYPLTCTSNTGSLPIRVSPSKTPVRSETGSKTGNRSGPNSGGSGNKVDLSGGLHTPSQSAPSSGNLGGAPGLSPEDLITLHAGPASTPIPATGQLPGSSQAAPSNSLQAADDTLAAEPASNPAGGAMASPRTAAAGAEDVPQLAEVPQGESVDDGTA